MAGERPEFMLSLMNNSSQADANIIIWIINANENKRKRRSKI
jgi:hypothetical protein